MEITGLAASYLMRDSYGDILLEGSFEPTIKNGYDHIPFCLFHDRGLVAGRPIELWETEKGLHHRTELFNTPVGRDAQRLIYWGALNSFSFAGKGCVKNINLGNYMNNKHGGSGIVIVKQNLDEYSLVLASANPCCTLEGVNPYTQDWYSTYHKLNRVFYTQLEVAEIRDYLIRAVQQAATYFNTPLYILR